MCQQTETPLDVPAVTQGKGKGKKGNGKVNERGKCTNNENKDATDNNSEREGFYCKTQGHIARHCNKRINGEKSQAGQHRDISKGNSASVNNAWQHWKRARRKFKLRTHHQFACHFFSSLQMTGQVASIVISGTL